MNRRNQIITVSGLPVEIVRKNIKNIYFRVYPPEGTVRVSAPKHISDEGVRLAVVSRMAWLQKQREKVSNQPRPVERRYVSGESCLYQGRPYALEVVEQYGKHSLCLLDDERMRLTVSPGTTTENRRLVVDSWYRQQLKGVIPELLEKWQPITGKWVNSWGVKRMKTRWGSCNITEARIWLNLELARKPPECLEYVLVHELVHLHERYHNANFKRLMDRFLPGWRERRDRLKGEPLFM
jgi:predicted metal-dependent hydrolase